MGWVDLALLAMLGVSIAIGLWRGLVSQMLSLVGWGVAYYAAHRFAPELAARLPLGTPGSPLNIGGAFGLLFLLTMLLWGILSWLVGQVVRASPLSGPDRLLGGVFGLARGLVIGMVAATLVGLTPFARSPDWQGSLGAAWLQVAVDGVRPMLPQQWMTLFPAALGETKRVE